MKSGWMLVASACFALMGAMVKLLSGAFSSAELVFYRSAFGLLTVGAGMLLVERGSLARLATQHGWAHVWRGLSGFTALVLFFYALGELPLATAVTLNYTAPLFLAGLSAWWLKERHGAGLVFAVILGFVGIVLVLQPQVEAAMWLPAAAGLASGFLAAVAYVHVKTLGRLGEPASRVVFYFTLLCTLLAAAWMAWAGAHRPQPHEWLWLLGIGVTATLGQLALTRAYQRGRTLTVGTLAYTTVAFSAGLGVGVFGESLPLVAWAGMVGVVAAGVVAVWVTRPGTAAYSETIPNARRRP